MSTIETMYRMFGYQTQEADMSQERNRSSITSVLSWIDTQFERRRSRRALLEMSDEQLKDIGISRADAYREGNRRIWI